MWNTWNYFCRGNTQNHFWSVSFDGPRQDKYRRYNVHTLKMETSLHVSIRVWFIFNKTNVLHDIIECGPIKRAIRIKTVMISTRERTLRPLQSMTRGISSFISCNKVHAMDKIWLCFVVSTNGLILTGLIPMEDDWHSATDPPRLVYNECILLKVHQTYFLTSIVCQTPTSSNQTFPHVLHFNVI